MSKPIDHNSPIPERNIVLVGMMGCGKSTVARSLAKLLTYPMVLKLKEKPISVKVNIN